MISPLPAQDQDHEPKVRKPLPSSEEIAKLPKDGGDEFNRLIHSKSPYLQQHARNPVDWYAWGAEAFEAAREQDKPIFLSIGYSTCHWCHVMEHESFEDPEVAKLMNDSFICVKVDREERPDIDQVYMTVTQAMTGRGGWPMTVLMTPDKQPFFAGTYFPRAGRHGRTGMMELVPQLSGAWKNDRRRVLEVARGATEHVAKLSSGTPGEALSESTLELCYSHLRHSYDFKRGGFGEQMKFPIPHNLRFLLRHHARSGDLSSLDMVETTLAAMRKGGIWDHVGFGFHRYSTDPNWLLPHFEKMLYDQALLALAYTEAWQVTGKDAYRETAEQVFTYVLRDMTSPKGGFFSAEDADSEGVEGLFYVWTLEQLKAALDEDDAALAAAVWNIREEGNFSEEATGEATGHNIPHLSQTLDELAPTRGMEPAELAAKMEVIRAKLFEVREPRVHPFKDDKILTDWNGLMIAAFAKAARVFDGREDYERAATAAAKFVLGNLRDERGRLLKSYRGGAADNLGLLEDYAFFTHGLLELFTTTQKPRFLEEAIALTDDMIARFWDERGGGFFLSPTDGEKLIVRSKESYDGAIPSGNSVAVMNLLWLARLTGNTKYDEYADKTIKAFAGQTSLQPQSYTQLMLAVDFLVGPSFEIVIAGDPAADDLGAMLSALNDRFLPNKVVVVRPAGGAGAKAISRLVPYTETQEAIDGKATAYVCQNFTCQAPTTDVATMLAALEQLEQEEESVSSGGLEQPDD
ncbi:MAG: thioredoxin domain-containing protein [bacterium]|nr:thioredoxin domain-containing protein [bacterium]